ncbi:hypothetical protein [Scytonema sp. PCC 10023]|uniref:hypothetical protein n=1 Tax=Scytonema sp. PCC 10023 TaxID=1680591 RepID=UPI0039C72FD6
MNTKSISSLEGHVISGIGSMIRDLGILSHTPDELESKILAHSDDIHLSLSSSLKLVSGTSIEARVGDIVLFKLNNLGAYPDMETLWGGRVPLKIGEKYIGVLCERGSTKLITGEFDEHITKLRECLELQLIAQAGGVGFATGFSPTLEKEYGYGQPSDVEILGALYDEKKGKVLNTLEVSTPKSADLSDNSVPPSILVLGTATDVGKTTAVCALLEELSCKYSCIAIKASGTGWYEDSLLHARSGAFPVLNFTFAGLPTTYYVDQGKYLNAMYELFNYAANPGNIPKKFMHPEMRDRVAKKSDIVIVEHGGDLIWANIPCYLRDSKLMTPVKVLLICSESALSLRGSLEELRSMGIYNSQVVKIFASVPLINPEAFYKRVEEYLKLGFIEGIFDVRKPRLLGNKERRCYYSANYSRILSCTELVEKIENHLFST